MTFLARMWAYVTLGAMGIVWEEASPLIGGLAAHDRNLALHSVVLAVALGTWLASLLLYVVGRSRSRWLRKRWPKLRHVILRSVALVRRHPWRAALAVRFAFGLRLALPLACGVARVPLLAYTVGTAVSCVVWSLVFSVLGWGLGQTTETLIGHVRDWEPYLGAALILSMVLGLLIVRRRHVAERTAHVLDPELDALTPTKQS